MDAAPGTIQRGTVMDLISRETALKALEEISYSLWEIDIPSPTVPEYIEHHEQVQGVMKLVDGWARKIQAAMPVPAAERWIPYSERLPKQGQEVICQCRANMIKVLKLDACGDWYQDAEHCYMSGFVIAWMPLPEPYKGGTGWMI